MSKLLLLVLILVIFISGCIGQTSEKSTSVGMSRTLSADITQVKTSVPVTFILSIKNLASEKAEFISAELLNLTEWNIENDLQYLEELLAGDSYKFSWVAYSPYIPNRSFLPFANLFYKMKTDAKLNIRVYNNDYLSTLSSGERGTIVERSALLSSTVSRSTPIGVTASLKQPFILTEYSQEFPFVIEIKNLGVGEPYNDDAGYPLGYSEKGYVRFSFTSNSTISCDFDDGSSVRLVNGAKNIVCRMSVTQDEVSKYEDFYVDFTIDYTYLDRAYTKIEVK
jgi:hypothetical protein